MATEIKNPASLNKWYQYQSLSPAHTIPELMMNLDVIDSYYGSGFTQGLIEKVGDSAISPQTLQSYMSQAEIDTFLTKDGKLTILKKTIKNNNNSNNYKTGSVNPSTATTSKYGKISTGKGSIPFYIDKSAKQADGNLKITGNTLSNKPRMYKNGVALKEAEKPLIAKTKISPSVGLASSIANIGTNILTGYEIVNFLTQGGAENKLRDLIPDEWENLIFGDGTIDATLSYEVRDIKGGELPSISDIIKNIKLYIDERFLGYSGLFASKNNLTGIQDYTDKEDNTELIDNLTSLNKWSVNINENIAVFSFQLKSENGNISQYTFTMDKAVNVAAITGIYNDYSAMLVVIASTNPFTVTRIVDGTATTSEINTPAHADNEKLLNYGYTFSLTGKGASYFTKENITTSVFKSNRNYNANTFPSDILGDVDTTIWTNIRDYLRWMVARKTLRNGNTNITGYYEVPKSEVLKGGFTKNYSVSIQENNIPFAITDNISFIISTNIGNIIYKYVFDEPIYMCACYCLDNDGMPFINFLYGSKKIFKGTLYHGDETASLSYNRSLYINKDLSKPLLYQASTYLSVDTVNSDYDDVTTIYSIKCDNPMYNTGYKGSVDDFFDRAFGKYTLDNFACYSLYNNVWYDVYKVAWDYIMYLIIYMIGTEKKGENYRFNGNLPCFSDVNTVDDVLEALKNKYPDLWANRIEEDTLQEDGSIKTTTKIPIPLPDGGEGDNPTTTNTNQYEQNYQPKDNEDEDEDEDEEEKTKQNTINNWMRNPDPDPNPDPEPDTSKSGVTPDYTPPTDIPAPTPPKGSGETPSIIIPIGTASALWSIYNPTLEQVKSLGGWLWSSLFADQILKVLADPMQAIISLHKVFGTPSISGTGDIKVGYLNSGISGVNIVDNQYTHINCGDVNLDEYFGNVFDYPPYTDIQIYLPFIGIVPLRAEDVLRSTITVTYDIDVLTGACLANINVLRDNAGGVLYTYNGNCAVEYPLSSGSYLGVVSTLLGIAGGFGVGGVAGGIIGGAMSLMNGKGTNIERSGNLSGNAGAMGIKKPYVIISRPITAMATDYQKYMGIPTNSLARIGDCKGFVSCKEVFIKSGTFESGKKQNLTAEQANEIESLLKNGVIIN